MSAHSDRAFENNLNDYTDENYLDQEHKLLKQHSDFIWNYLNTAISKLNHAVESSSINYNDPSVYTGTSGIALTYLKLYEITNDKNYLDKSHSLIKMSLENLSRDRFSYLCGDAGPLTIAAYSLYLKEDLEGCKKQIQRLIKRSENVLAQSEKMCDELLYGRVGYAYSLLFVQRKISKDLIPNTLIIDLFSVIIESGKRLSNYNKISDHAPLMYEWHGKKYIGAAHGISGIIYILLNVANEFSDFSAQVQYLILPTINFLMSCKYPSGNYQSSLESNSDKLVQFCHGSAGVEFMFNLAFKTTRNRQYLDEAIRCGEVTWSRGLLRKGYGLCHGVAGNGYTFLDLYNLTHEPKWLHRAWMFAKWCCTPNERQTGKPERPFSLFEGLAGTIYFLLDMLNPNEAKFPGLQI